VTGDTQEKQVILSFDDGPHPLSKSVVSILDKVGVKAHFFQLGKSVQRYPEITQLIASRGHSIGNHSWDHPDFTTISFDEQVRQISDTNRIILNTIGWIDPFFRYPYGAKTSEMNEYLKDHSEANFLWSIDSNDWKKINSDRSIRTNAQVIEETMNQLEQRGRGLVLFHDVHARTIELLPTFLSRLHSKGYKIVLLQASNSGLRNSPRLP
jgi:peptidoglycan/xylan/chitin deacetylase (PgdA/CDA1 family)